MTTPTMSASIDGTHGLNLVESTSRDSVYSPASSYSTYSHEVKYIFDPVEDSVDEYGDYSHIAPRSKQNYLSHTPRTLSAASQVSGKENQTPLTLKEDHVFDPPSLMTQSRTNSVLSCASRDRGPISPHMEEALYSSTHFGYGPRKQSVQSEQGPRDRTYFSPGSDVPAHPYAKHAYPASKNSNYNNINNFNNHNNSFSTSANNFNHNKMQQPQHPSVPPKNSNFHQDNHRYNINRNTGGGGQGLNTFHNQHPLNSVHNYHHYQQPYVQSHQGNEPPYPMPPRYSHQQHSRRKTWSPPAMKMSLLTAATQGTRVCLSNDSLEVAEEAGIERKTQSLSEDLDVTPPRLAPISGVLAQRPGPNLIKPIAFKPVHASPERSPLGYANRRVSGSDDHMNGSHDMARPHTMKLGTSMLGIRGSPDSQNNKSNLGAFNSMAKMHPHTNTGTRLTPNSHHGDNTSLHHHHPPPSHPHPPPSVNSSHSSSHHNSSSSSHHNSYSNIHPGNQHNMSANSSHLSGADEASFSNEFPRLSDRPDSVPSLNASRVSSHAVEGMLQTPSPSDSGVGELEAMLREKDAEINTLREVMDRNERAIFQVYEERRHGWLQDTQELRDDYERKLKVQSRKSYKTEQVLSLQVYKLQQEQKTLQEEKSQISSEKDMLKQQVEENQAEISELKSRLAALTGNGVLTRSLSLENQAMGGATGSALSDPALQEELALKNKELITLKSQLQAYQTDMEKKNKEVADKVRDVSSKTDQVKSLKEELLRLKDPPVLLEASSQTHAPGEVTPMENMKPSMLGERDRTINGLQDELLEIRAQVTAMKDEHEKEREQWLDEKNKVVRYQKQLQLNYVQMQRKNATLETEVQQLTLELENRDMKLIALNGEESVC